MPRLLFAAGLFIATAAQAGDIDRKQLIGKWTGELTFKVGAEVHKVPIAMTFGADGKLVTASGESREQTSTWRVEHDTVVCADPETRGNDVKLTEVRLSGATLAAKLVPAKVDEATPEIVLSLSLKRVR